MKYIVEVTASNPSHEHISLRRVQKKTSFVVEANNENEALMRARGKFRSLGHYVHNVQLIEKKAPYEYETGKWGPKTGGRIKTSKPGEWDPKTNRYWRGTETGDESYEDRFDNTPNRITDKKTGELIWDRKETGDNWRYFTRDELERKYRSEREYDGTLRTAGFNAPGTNKPFSGPGSEFHSGEDAKTQDFETWRKNFEKYGKPKVSFGKDAPSFVGDPVHPDESKWNDRKGDEAPVRDSNSGPSEEERLRYGDIGAQIRHIDPEAYKNRPKDAKGNIDLLAKLKANNMRNEEVEQVDEKIDDPASDIRKQGVTGARIKALSSNQFSTRKDRLDQSKVDSILGANKYKAGSTESNLALLKYFKDKAASVSGQQDNQTTSTPTDITKPEPSVSVQQDKQTTPEPEKPEATPEKKPGFFKRLGNAIRNNDDGYTVFGKESQKEKDRMGNKLSVGGVDANKPSDVIKSRENLSNIGADAAKNDSAPTTGPKVKYEIGKSEVSSDEFEKEKSRGNLAKDYKFTLKNKDGTQRVVGSKDSDYKDLVGKYVKEENSVEYIEEKLTAADPASKWISDFVKSDNPKFAGKSKKERIRMALGAKYAAMRNEEVEQLSEGPSHYQYSGTIHSNVGNAKHGEEKDDGHSYSITIPTRGAHQGDLGSFLSSKKAFSKISRENPHLEPHHVLAVMHGTGDDVEDVEVDHKGKTYKHRLYNTQEPDYLYEEVEQIDERVSLGAPVSDQLKAKEKVAKSMEDKPDTAVARIDKSIENTKDKDPEYSKRVSAFKDEYLKKKKAADAGETTLVAKEEVEQIDEADTSDANYDMINRDALPVPPHRNIRGVQDRINADKRKERDAAAQEKEKAKDKISIALDRVKAKSKLNKINTKPEMDADVKGK